MRQITVDPFRGVEMDGVYVCFGTHWKAVEEKLGLPEHRYVGYTPEDALMILGERGEYIQDYISTPLPKGDFEEERNGVRFIYRDFSLVTVWASVGTVVAVGEVLLKGNGIEDFANCATAHRLEHYEWLHRFAIKEYGVICDSHERAVGYAIHSALSFTEEMQVLQAAHDRIAYLRAKRV